jgi:hypothetical protein
MKDEEGNTLNSYDNHEGLKPLPRNAMECEVCPWLETVWQHP